MQLNPPVGGRPRRLRRILTVAPLALALVCLTLPFTTSHANAGSVSLIPPGGLAAKADDGAKITSATQVGRRTVDLVIDSPALGKSASVRLLVPLDYVSKKKTKWPVLWLMHGAGEPVDYQSWTHFTDVEQLTLHSEIMIVMPSDGLDGMFSDWWNSGTSTQPGYETFHMTELPQILDRGWHTGKPRAIAGISIGGFGAASYAGRHPGYFKSVASFSGLLDTQAEQASDVFIPGLIAREGDDPNALWGDPHLNSSIWAAHNPIKLLSALKGVKFFISAGNGRPGPLDPPGAIGDAIEPEALSEGQEFASAALNDGYNVTTDFYGNGTHSWPYWQQELHRAWPMLAHSLGVPANPPSK